MTYIPLMVHTDDYLDFAATVRRRGLERDSASGQFQGEHPFTMAGAGRTDAEVQDGSGSTRALQPWLSWNRETCEAAQTALIQHPAWPRESLERFARSEYETVERWKLVMDHCAVEPNTFFSTSQVVEATTLELNQWRDAPRKLPNHLKKHYPEVVPLDSWPLVAVGGREKLGLTHEVYWAMTGDVAEMWRDIRGLELDGS